MQKRSIDYTLLITVIILIVYGLLMVLSASYYTAQSSKNYDYDGFALFKKQLTGAIIGTGALLVFAFAIDYRKLMKLKYPILFVAIGLLIAVLIPGIGEKINGSSRWINIGPLPSIQPSEVAKFAVVIFLAATIYVNRNRMQTLRYGIVPSFCVLLVICALIYKQPNYSAIILMCLLTYIMLFIGGAKWWHLAVIAVVGILLGYMLMMQESYRESRVTSFLDPWADPTGDGHQVIQSLYGIGSGGLFGSGLGNGRQKLSWLPYSESDFIFSIIAEELGLIGALALLFLFGLFIYRGIRIAATAPDFFGTMLAAGFTSIIALQVVINVAVVTSSIPATGVSLPFISYGSSSLVILMAMTGVLLNISRQARSAVTDRRRQKKVDTARQEPLAIRALHVSALNKSGGKAG